jgi:hypothetical protein
MCSPHRFDRRRVGALPHVGKRAAPACCASHKKRGVGERWHEALSTADPLTTRRGTRPVPQAIPIRTGAGQSALGAREAQASISPTPSVVDSGVIFADGIATLRADVALLNLKSPTARSGELRSSVRLLLLLRGCLALRRSLLLRGGLRLCLLHHAALLAKSSGGVASALTRIVSAAFRLLQQKEKNSFRIKETYIPWCEARNRKRFAPFITRSRSLDR